MIKKFFQVDANIEANIEANISSEEDESTLSDVSRSADVTNDANVSPR